MEDWVISMDNFVFPMVISDLLRRLGAKLGLEEGGNITATLSNLK